FRGPMVKTSVDVHLLVLRRTVAAVSARRSIGGRFHAGEHLTRELAAADRVEGERGAGGGEHFDELVHERRRTRIQHVLRTESLEEIHVLLPTDDVHERDPVFDADIDQHLTEVRRRDGVHQSGVALRAHRLDHAERRQRVHEARCALRRRLPGGSTRHWLALIVRNCAYIAPPRIATVFPTRARASSEDPARMTTPAPSFPTGSGWSMRPAMLRRAAGGIGAVTTGSWGLPEPVAADGSAPAGTRP